MLYFTFLIILYKIDSEIAVYAVAATLQSNYLSFFHERMVPMKKLFAFLLAALIGVMLAACDKDSTAKTDIDTSSDEIVGGWTNTESLEVTEDVKALLDKAATEMVGATYEPVAYLGTQVVAGTNHLLLCKVTPVTPDAVATYALVTVYEDLEGGAKIIDVLNSNAEAVFADAPGSWTESEKLDVTKESKEALEHAAEYLTGATYSPVALLATQVVSGTNYRILCSVTPVTPNAESSYEIVEVFVSADDSSCTMENYEFIVEEEN